MDRRRISKEQVKGTAAQCLYRNFAVVEHNPRKRSVSRIGELLSQRAEHGLQRAIKTFASPVGLRMVRTAADLIDTKVVQEDLHESRHKIRSLVRQDLLGKTKMAENVGKCLSHILGSIVSTESPQGNVCINQGRSG